MTFAQMICGIFATVIVYVAGFLALVLAVSLLPLFEPFFAWWHYRHTDVIQVTVSMFIFFLLVKMMFFPSKNKDPKNRKKSEIK